MFPKAYFPVTYFPVRYFMSGTVTTVSTVGYFYKYKTNIYVSKASHANATADNTILLSVSDFSFNQQTISVIVSRDTLDPLQARTVKPFITAVLPIDFTFTTYVLPMVDPNSPNYTTSPEENLWIGLLGSDSLDASASIQTIDFADGNVGELHNLTLWFEQDGQGEGNYRIDNAVIDSATISFDINNIAQIEWRGRALSLSIDNSPPLHEDRTNNFDNVIKNRFSTISLSVNNIDYNIALTGGGLTINNNNTFYGRNKLGQTTVPVGSYTGNRVIDGDIEFYMKAGDTTGIDLYNNITSAIKQATYEDLYEADITINIGGEIGARLIVDIPAAILDIAELRFENAIKMNVPFTAKEESGYTQIIYRSS